MEKLISIDLQADFGFLRKPDTNDGISMSYNMLHKPGLLGILGAILGLQGYQRHGELPQYYQRLHVLRVGIAPLGDDNGNFPKSTIVYTNTVGYANKDGNLIACENTLIRPSFRIYIAVSDSHPLYDNLKNVKAEYIPYLGKNEFPVWWTPESFQEYELRPFANDFQYQVRTLFRKKEGESSRSNEADQGTVSLLADISTLKESFFYFERLPVGFQEFDTKRGKEYQYEMAPFVYSNAKFSSDFQLENLYVLNVNEVVQLN
jgi:CRISPR-associated protein Cas5h